VTSILVLVDGNSVRHVIFASRHHSNIPHVLRLPLVARILHAYSLGLRHLMVPVSYFQTLGIWDTALISSSSEVVTETEHRKGSFTNAEKTWMKLVKENAS
jgi:hypothetical protein